MSNFSLDLRMIVATILLFSSALAVNEWLFSQSEFVRGINWIYLPAGMRLLCTLLFGGPGVIGLLIASWLASFLYYFPDDFVRPFAGGIISAVAPYIVYLAARYQFGLSASLTNLTPVRLMICIVAYAFSSALLHHLWFALSRSAQNIMEGFLVMFLGDLTGSLLIVYIAKALLSLATCRHRRSY